MLQPRHRTRSRLRTRLTGIADYYNWLGVFGIQPFAECSAAAKQAASKAVALDPTPPKPTARSELQPCARFRLGRCRGASPARDRDQSELRDGASLVWIPSGDGREGSMKRSVKCRARANWTALAEHHAGVRWCYYQARRFNESITTYRNMLEAAPDFSLGWQPWLGLSETRRPSGGGGPVAEKAVALSNGPILLATLGAAYAAAGKVEQAQQKPWLS